MNKMYKEPVFEFICFRPAECIADITASGDWEGLVEDYGT